MDQKMRIWGSLIVSMLWLVVLILNIYNGLHIAFLLFNGLAVILFFAIFLVSFKKRSQ